MPVRGYPDYQRVENWDGPEVLTNFGTLNTGKVESPIVECSRYGYLTGSIGTGVNDAALKVEYFYDAAGTQFIGIRQMILSTNPLNTGQVNLPNLGPFMKVIVKPLTEGTQWEGFIRLFLSNRLSPTELRLPVPLLAEGEHAFLGAEGFLVPAAGYFAGPIRVYASMTAGETAFSVETQAIPQLGVASLVDKTLLAKAGEFTALHVMPSTACFFVVRTGGPANVLWRMTPFTSGAS